MDLITTFIQKGTILELTLGSSKELVLNTFGKPEDVIWSEDLEFFKYGSLEVVFQKNVVLILSFDIFDKEIFFPESLNIEPTSFNENLDTFTLKLEEANIGWHLCIEKSQDNVVALALESGVVVYYEFPAVGFTKLQLSKLTLNLYKYIEIDHLKEYIRSTQSSNKQ